MQSSWRFNSFGYILAEKNHVYIFQFEHPITTGLSHLRHSIVQCEKITCTNQYYFNRLRCHLQYVYGIHLASRWHRVAFLNVVRKVLLRYEFLLIWGFR